MRSSVRFVLMGTQPVAMLCVVEACLHPATDVRRRRPDPEIGLVRAVLGTLFRRCRREA